MIKIAIFASGSGSNAENIVTNFAGDNEVCFPYILVNKQDAYVHERAKKLGIPSQTFSKQQLEDGTILKQLQNDGIDFIILAGFLLKIPEAMVEAYPRRIVNIHPALLPNYGGKGMYGHHVHEAVVAAKETESGITIHYVDSHYDHGNTICQAHCPVAPTDTPDDVAANVHKLEYIYFPAAIRQALAEIKK
ncbi:MAG: phosphoribosylglycinamide formyltransferase [Paludibacteraceae bacterium]|nr:phosphoribosylglycinamide formyltransferase [Paludibacteraceae bacterium]